MKKRWAVSLYLWDPKSIFIWSPWSHNVDGLQCLARSNLQAYFLVFQSRILCLGSWVLSGTKCVSSQRTSSLSPKHTIESSPSLSFHLTAIAHVLGTKLTKSSLGWVYLSNICCLLSCSLKSFLGPSSVFLLSLISLHKSVPPFPSSFILLFFELSPICLHISTAGYLNIICWSKSCVWRDPTN